MEKKSYHHNDLRNALIEKGIEFVNTEGFSQFSLRKVALACGVSHAAPYSHFQSKEALLDTMQSHVTSQFTAMLEETISAHPNEPVILEYLGKAYVQFFVENPHYFSFLFQRSTMQIDLSLQSKDAENYQPFEIYKKIVLSLLKKTALPKEKYKDAIIVIWAFIHGIASLATMKNVTYDEDWDEKISDFMDIFDCYFLKTNNTENEAQ